MPFVTNLPHESPDVITLVELKRQMRFDNPKEPDIEDDLLKSYIKAAVLHAERIINSEITEKKIKITGFDFEDALSFDKQIVTAVDTFNYKTPTGSILPVPTDQYYLNQVSNYENKITFKEGYELPELIENDPQAVTIEVTLGYANGNIPENMKLALLMQATTFDSNRESGPYYNYDSVKSYLEPVKRY